MAQCLRLESTKAEQARESEVTGWGQKQRQRPPPPPPSSQVTVSLTLLWSKHSSQLWILPGLILPSGQTPAAQLLQRHLCISHAQPCFLQLQWTLVRSSHLLAPFSLPFISAVIFRSW